MQLHYKLPLQRSMNWDKEGIRKSSGGGMVAFYRGISWNWLDLERSFGLKSKWDKGEILTTSILHFLLTIWYQEMDPFWIANYVIGIVTFGYFRIVSSNRYCNPKSGCVNTFNCYYICSLFKLSRSILAPFIYMYHLERERE